MRLPLRARSVHVLRTGATATAPLDQAGQGWTLHQLCLAGQQPTAVITHQTSWPADQPKKISASA